MTVKTEEEVSVIPQEEHILIDKCKKDMAQTLQNCGRDGPCTLQESERSLEGRYYLR
jgi:hypothetical protein